MKLIIAIVQDQHDAGKAVDALIGNGFGATRINTAGGFLKRGNSTILIGVEDDRAHDAIQILRDACHHLPGENSDPTTTSGIVFVLPVGASFKM